MAPACHNVTDFARWFKAQASDPPYSVMYKAEFEPWFISGRRQTQWFDVRFRGYGKNKVGRRMRTRGCNHLSSFMPCHGHFQNPVELQLSK